MGFFCSGFAPCIGSGCARTIPVTQMMAMTMMTVVIALSATTFMYFTFTQLFRLSLSLSAGKPYTWTPILYALLR